MSRLSVAVCAEALTDPRPCGTKTFLVKVVSAWATRFADRVRVTVVAGSPAGADRLREVLPAGSWSAAVVKHNYKRRRLRWLAGGGSLTPHIGPHDVYLSGWHWPLGRLDRPFVAIFHDLEPLAFADDYRGSLRRRVYLSLFRASVYAACRRAAAVVSISEATLAHLEQVWGRPLPPATVVPHGVEPGDWSDGGAP